MNLQKTRFPRWVTIFLIICWLIIFAAGYHLVQYHNKHALDADYYVNVIFNTSIAGFAITALMLTAYVILLGITVMYVKQTATMAAATRDSANATKRILDYYYKVNKDQLKPQFIPLDEGYDMQSADCMCFLFINVGAEALYVKIDIQGIVRHFDDFHHRIKHEVPFTVGPLNRIELAQAAKAESVVYIHIQCKDRLLSEYEQMFRFSWKDQKFLVDNSCLPKAITSPAE